MNKNLRNVILIVATLVMGVVIGYAHGQDSQPRPRYEWLYSEEQKDTNILIRAIHDKESGAEVLCFSRYGGMTADSYAMSCVPTGRNWK